MSGKSVWYMQHFRHQWRFCIVICSISVWLASRLANGPAICVVYATLSASELNLYWFLQYTWGCLKNEGTMCVVYATLSASVLMLYWFLQYI